MIREFFLIKERLSDDKFGALDVWKRDCKVYPTSVIGNVGDLNIGYEKILFFKLIWILREADDTCYKSPFTVGKYYFLSKFL